VDGFILYYGTGGTPFKWLKLGQGALVPG